MRTLVLSIVGLCLTTPACALSCLEGVHGMIPGENSVDVPVDAQIVLAHTWSADSDIEVTVVDGSGTVVEGEVVLGRYQVTFRPEMDLAVNTSHEVSVDTEFQTFSFVFTTGADVDVAPITPQIADIQREKSMGEWGPTERMAVSFAEDDNARYEVQLSTSEDFSDPMTVSSGESTVWVGRGLCEDTAPDYSHKETYYVRTRAINLAGDATEWVVTESPQTGRGCHTAGSVGASGMLTLLALVGLRRRR